MGMERKALRRYQNMLIDKNSESFDSYIIEPDLSVYDAYLKMMSNREKTLIVADDGGVYGSITSGDFKRKISYTINKELLEASSFKLSDLWNENFYFLSDKDELNINCDHLLVPVVNKKNILENLLVRGSPSSEIIIGNKIIGRNHPPIIIAEIGVNHDGNIDIAKNLIDQAKQSGSDFVKFQHRSLKDTYIESSEGDSELSTESTIDHLKKVNLSIDELRLLFDYARSKKIEPICTPFDLSAFKEIMTLNPIAFKIASADLLNFSLVEEVAKTNLPLILSSGMHNEEEIISAINFTRLHNDKLILLHCVSSYPAEISSLNTRYIAHLRKITGCLVGYSSHDNGIAGSLSAVSLGACVIEKHITWNREAEGPDHNASSEFDEFATLCKMSSQIFKTLGPINISEKKLSQGEIMNRSNLSKSLYASRKIKKGDIVSESDFLCKSPGVGIPCSSLKFITGKEVLDDIESNQPIFDSSFFKNNNPWMLTNSVPINSKWGIPVRFRDVNYAIETFQPNFVEFHLTYSDLNYKDYDSLNIANCGAKVHAPELFAENFIIDMAINDKKVRDLSIEYMKRTVDTAHSIYSKSAQNTSLDLVINPGGHSSDDFLSEELKPMMFENLFNSFKKIDFGLVNPVIQSMPPFPWHLGGRRYHNMFVNLEDFKKWHDLTGYKFCIDYSHSYLAAKFLNIPFEKYADALIPYSSYYHIADADGTDGEGLQILDGEVNFKSIYENSLSKHAFEYIPEIWQGHIDNFSGFKLALSNLRKLGW